MFSLKGKKKGKCSDREQLMFSAKRNYLKLEKAVVPIHISSQAKYQINRFELHLENTIPKKKKKGLASRETGEKRKNWSTWELALQWQRETFLLFIMNEVYELSKRSMYISLQTIEPNCYKNQHHWEDFFTCNIFLCNSLKLKIIVAHAMQHCLLVDMYFVQKYSLIYFCSYFICFLPLCWTGLYSFSSVN